MRKLEIFTLVLLVFGILWMPKTMQGQGFFGDYCDGGTFTDTLDVVELSGKAIVLQSETGLRYYLDVDSNDQADYLLSFGPIWYEPNNGNQRPENGDEISVKGFLMQGMIYEMLMVNELNGLDWRYFNEGLMGDWHGFNHWVNDLEEISVTGQALVDSSYYYPQYFLDVNEDEDPDYYLHFGPFWFQSESGATRPADGQSISIIGGLSGDYMGHTSIMVYEIDGQVWRDSTGPHPWSGNWVHRNFNDSLWVYCQSDSLSVLGFPQGCFGQSGGMMMFPDSLFCAFEQIHPNFAPGGYDSTMIACYFMDLIDQDGMGMMSDRGYGHGSRRLQRNPLIRLHYPEARLQLYNLSESKLVLNGFDPKTEAWVEVTGFTPYRDQNLITVNRNDVYQYYAIFAPEASSLGVLEDLQGGQSRLNLQVYPNPVSEQLHLRFDLPEAGQVSIQIFSMTGRLVANKILSNVHPGSTEFQFDLSAFSDMKSGIYYVEMISGGNREVKEFLFTQ